MTLNFKPAPNPTLEPVTVDKLMKRIEVAAGTDREPRTLLKMLHAGFEGDGPNLITIAPSFRTDYPAYFRALADIIENEVTD